MVPCVRASQHKSPLGAVLGRSWGPLGLILGSLGRHLGGLLGYFSRSWALLEGFWERFGCKGLSERIFLEFVLRLGMAEP